MLRLAGLPVISLSAFLAALSLPPTSARRAVAEEPKPPATTKNAWTLVEAQETLKLNPRDRYLQYVALQLARHAMVRIRPQNWNLVLPSYRLGWAENNREACLNNLGPLAYVARAISSSEANRDPAKFGSLVHRHADQLHGVHFFCPEGGKYVPTADGKGMTCSVHGGLTTPRQGLAPAADSPAGDLIRRFSGLTAALTFREDGLHAVVTVNRANSSAETRPADASSAKRRD